FALPRQGAPLYFDLLHFDVSGSGFDRRLPNRIEEDEEALSPLGAMSKRQCCPELVPSLAIEDLVWCSRRCLSRNIRSASRFRPTMPLRYRDRLQKVERQNALVFLPVRYRNFRNKPRQYPPTRAR